MAVVCLGSKIVSVEKNFFRCGILFITLRTRRGVQTYEILSMAEIAISVLILSSFFAKEEVMKNYHY